VAFCNVLTISSGCDCARPIAWINACAMSPAPECMKTITRYILTVRCVVEESKVFSVVNNHFKTLIINLEKKENKKIIFRI